MPDLAPFTLTPGYRVDAFAEQTSHSRADAVAMWIAEGLVDAGEAERRASEVVAVGTAPDGSLAGLSTAYLALSPRLGFVAWHYRTAVARAHRRTALALFLAGCGRDFLSARWASGEDTRAPAIVFEVENPELKRHLDHAEWWPLDYVYIGDTPRGDHVRVHYLPGATLPTG